MAVRFANANARYRGTTGLPAGAAARTWTATFWFQVVEPRGTWSNAFSLSDSASPTNYIAAGTGQDGLIRYVSWENSGPGGNGIEATGTARNAVDDGWTRMAVVCNGTSITLYYGDLTGALQTAPTPVTGLPPITPTELFIGNDTFDTSWLNGCVAGFKLWSVALSATEIAAEFTQFQPVRAAGLLQYHRLATGSAAGATVTGSPGTLVAGSVATTTAADPPGVPETASTPVALAGNASAAAGATGALVAARPLAGIAPAAAGATGVLSAGRPIAGTAAAAGGATGALSRGRPVAGTVPAAAGATGALSSTRPLAATVAGAGSFTGDLTVLEDGSMSATVAAAASASGALGVARPLAGQVAGAAELTGALIVGRQRALAGTIAGASSADALLTVLGESAWSGNVVAAAELVGALSAARELVGSVDVVAELTGAWHVERPPQPLPTPGDPLPPASSGWRPSPASTYRPPTVIYADA